MPTTRNAALAAELRAEKARQSLTGSELARRVGKPQTTVARYLRGDTDMSLDDIELFAAALNVTTVDLIMRSYERTPPGPFAPAGEQRPDDRSGDTRRNNPCYSDTTVILGPWSAAPAHASAA